MKIEIIENFFEKRHFEDLNNITLKKINKGEISVVHNEIVDDRIIVNNGISEDLLIDLNRTYHEKAINILAKLCPEKVKLYEYSDFTIINTGSHYKFPIHDDTPNKLLSGVIYLKPEKNNGTFFYNNKNGDGETKIEWRQNKAVFFSRIEKETWHSYEGDKISSRVAIVYNLMTRNIKQVANIENKNYFLTFFRYKINPYLYRFFKLTI